METARPQRINQVVETLLSAIYVRADALLLAPIDLSGVEFVSCPRCNGQGFAFFRGGSNAPGRCFRCSGSGKVAGRGARKLKAAEGNRMAARYVFIADTLVSEVRPVVVASADSRATEELRRLDVLVDQMRSNATFYGKGK